MPVLVFLFADSTEVVERFRLLDTEIQRLRFVDGFEETPGY